jgi:hypothetical protein
MWMLPRGSSVVTLIVRTTRAEAASLSRTMARITPDSPG